MIEGEEPYRMPEPPTGCVTFLFTDIVDSTKRWEAAPEARTVALARHDALIRAAVAAHPGYIFGTAGDAFTVAHTLAPFYPGGVVWVALAAVTNPARVLPTIAEALGLRELVRYNYWNRKYS